MIHKIKQRLFPYTEVSRSGDNSIGILTDYGLDDPGIRDRFRAGIREFLFSTASKSDLGSANSPIQLVMKALSLRDKAAGALCWPITLFSAEVKNAWNYTSAPTYIHGVVFN
jgi:hypothetical protein